MSEWRCGAAVGGTGIEAACGAFAGLRHGAAARRNGVGGAGCFLGEAERGQYVKLGFGSEVKERAKGLTDGQHALPQHVSPGLQ